MTRPSPPISGIIGATADVVDPIVTTCTLGPLVTTPSELAAFQRDNLVRKQLAGLRHRVDEAAVGRGDRRIDRVGRQARQEEFAILGMAPRVSG